jgi:hypothetical protein
MALGFQSIVKYDKGGCGPMSDSKFTLTLPFDYEIVLALFSLKLISEGFHVAHSFELHASCASFTETTCPHNGKSACDCRLVTLLAYEQNGLSIPLVFHGHAGQTEVFIDTISGRTNLDFDKRIQAVLQEESATLLKLNR